MLSITPANGFYSFTIINAASSRLNLNWPIPTGDSGTCVCDVAGSLAPVNLLQILEGVAFGGCPDCLTDHLVEINKPFLTQELIEFSLHCGVAHGKTLKSRGLIGGVMVDVGARKAHQVINEEPHQLFEGELLGRMVMRPDGDKVICAIRSKGGHKGQTNIQDPRGTKGRLPYRRKDPLLQAPAE